MSEVAEPEETAEAKAGNGLKVPIAIGFILALALGGGGFYAAYTGLIGDDNKSSIDNAELSPKPEPLPDMAFVEIEPMIISLADLEVARHLRFRGHLEVYKGQKDAVQALMPRITDVLNGYLRAVEPSEMIDSAILIKLRAQMLRRVRLVVGEGRVRDLLIAEFVIN